MNVTDLPALNACLNAASTVFLVLGYVLIRRQRITGHRRCMLAACGTSILFLVSYITYHIYAGRTVFVNPAWFRPIYLVILLTHTVLAMVIAPMILVTLTLAFKGHWDQHKRIARWTWPIWMYVSVTGVIIYWLLYVQFPQK
jgi:putative membrane protein